MRVAQSALAPLLLRGEQPLNARVLRVGGARMCLFRRRACPHSEIHVAHHASAEGSYAALIQTLALSVILVASRNFVSQIPNTAPRRGCSRINRTKSRRSRQNNEARSIGSIDRTKVRSSESSNPPRSQRVAVSGPGPPVGREQISVGSGLSSARDPGPRGRSGAALRGEFRCSIDPVAARPKPPRHNFAVSKSLTQSLPWAACHSKRAAHTFICGKP